MTTLQDVRFAARMPRKSPLRRAPRVIGMVLRQGVRLVAAGIVVGLARALAAALATAVPAKRAAGVDPLTALRSE